MERIFLSPKRKMAQSEAIIMCCLLVVCILYNNNYICALYHSLQTYWGLISLKPNTMNEHLILNGLTVERLSEMIREAVREEMRKMQLPNWREQSEHYLSRKEVAALLKISLVTLTSWINRGKIKAHKIGGRVLFRESDVKESVAQIIPIKPQRR